MTSVADRRPAGRATATLLAGALLLLAGCSGGGGPKKDFKTIEEDLGFEREGIVLRQANAANLIRACMTRQGFEEYTAEPKPPGADLSDEDYEKQFGYGITTVYGKDEGGGANRTYRDSLSPTEQVDYDRTLYGDDPTATFADAVDNGDFTRVGGCTKEATDKVFGGAAVIQSLQTKLDALDDRIQQDPRMGKAVAKWSTCMQKAGYEDVAAPDEVDTVLHNKLEAIVGPPESPKPDYDKAALSALQNEERAIVAADVKCEAKNIDDVELKVRKEYEATFREQNADLISKVPPP
jgi:hypothetical protein